MASEVLFRLAQTADAEALARVHEDAWRQAYQGIIPGLELERMLSRSGPGTWQRRLRSTRRRSSLIVLEVGGDIRGYAGFGPARSHAREAAGEIYELYLTPAYQGVGLGGMLFRTTRETLTAAGLRGLVVWALAENEMACGFYRSMGGLPAGSRDEKVGTVLLPRVAFLWPKHAGAGLRQGGRAG